MARTMSVLESNEFFMSERFWLHVLQFLTEYSTVIDAAVVSLARCSKSLWCAVARLCQCRVKITLAAEHGWLDIVQFLNEHPWKRFAVDLMECAAKNGHLHVVQWLMKHREDPIHRAIVAAAGKGHLHVVQYLYNYETEEMRTWALDTAADSKQWPVVLWLHNMGVVHGPTMKALRNYSMNSDKNVREKYVTPEMQQLFDTMPRSRTWPEFYATKSV